MLQLQFSNCQFECGTDEAGRGCLAGPVTAAAVILKKDFKSKLITDSKKLSKNQREEAKNLIIENSIAYAICNITNKQIDKINILNASISAMHKAILKLDHKVDFISVDGNRFKPINNINYKTIIKGDEKYLNIAAASILAKTYRDNYMEKISSKFSKTYCNTTNFGISNEGALAFAIGETNKEYKNNKLNKYIDYSLLKNSIANNVENNCQIYDFSINSLEGLKFA